MVFPRLTVMLTELGSIVCEETRLARPKVTRAMPLSESILACWKIICRWRPIQTKMGKGEMVGGSWLRKGNPSKAERKLRNVVCLCVGADVCTVSERAYEEQRVCITMNY